MVNFFGAEPTLSIVKDSRQSSTSGPTWHQVCAFAENPSRTLPFGKALHPLAYWDSACGSQHLCTTNFVSDSDSARMNRIVDALHHRFWLQEEGRQITNKLGNTYWIWQCLLKTANSVRSSWQESPPEKWSEKQKNEQPNIKLIDIKFIFILCAPDLHIS